MRPSTQHNTLSCTSAITHCRGGGGGTLPCWHGPDVHAASTAGWGLVPGIACGCMAGPLLCCCGPRAHCLLPLPRLRAVRCGRYWRSHWAELHTCNAAAAVGRAENVGCGSACSCGQCGVKRHAHVYLRGHYVGRLQGSTSTTARSQRREPGALCSRRPWQLQCTCAVVLQRASQSDGKQRLLAAAPGVSYPASCHLPQEDLSKYGC